MGKEIRAGLSVVGALLLGFCVLVYARFARGPFGSPDAAIEMNAENIASTPVRHQLRKGGVPTIVRNHDPYDSPTETSPRLDNPRRSDRDQYKSEERYLRERRFLPIAPGPTHDDFTSSGTKRPDAVAPSPTNTVTVEAEENLQALAARLYGSSDFERALWQWLFDRDQVESVQPGATLELPTRATLTRTYPHLLPAE